MSLALNNWAQMCFPILGSSASRIQKAQAESFIHIFVNNSPKLTEFLEHMISVSNFTLSVGLGGSVGCAVGLETRRSRVQPLPKSATFFRGD